MGSRRGGGRKSGGSTARSDPEDRGGRGPPPEQQTFKAVSPRHRAQLVYYAIAVSAAVRSSQKPC